MTTTVRVIAHCHSSKEVQVKLNSKKVAVLQDGESADFHVYDDREISVKEVVKETSGD